MQPQAASATRVAVSADTGVALVTPEPAASATTPTGLIAINRSVLPAQLAWDGNGFTLTVMPGFTPLLTSSPATTLAGCAAVDEQPNVLGCTAGVDSFADCAWSAAGSGNGGPALLHSYFRRRPVRIPNLCTGSVEGDVVDQPRLADTHRQADQRTRHNPLQLRQRGVVGNADVVQPRQGLGVDQRL